VPIKLIGFFKFTPITLAKMSKLFLTSILF